MDIAQIGWLIFVLVLLLPVLGFIALFVVTAVVTLLKKED